MFRRVCVIIRELFCACWVTLKHANVMVSSGWQNFKTQMIKSSSYSLGYIVKLKCAVSDGRIYTCSACCYCDWRGTKAKKIISPVESFTYLRLLCIRLKAIQLIASLCWITMLKPYCNTKILNHQHTHIILQYRLDLEQLKLTQIMPNYN
jgi:hypothetical protein